MQNKVLYGLTGAIAMGAFVPAQAQKKPMNIVFIMSDDHRIRHQCLRQAFHQHT